jgi:homoserine kinase
LHAGAISCNISGSGPTIFCFTLQNCEAIALEMERAFQRVGLESTAAIMKIENHGAAIV